MRLKSFHYTIVHIPDEDNCWADLLCRWGPKHSEQERSLFVRASLSLLFTAPVAPELDSEIIWPKPADLMAAQKEAMETREETIPTQKRSYLHTN